MIKEWHLVWIPLVGAFTWFGINTLLIIAWSLQGSPRLINQSRTLPYISEIGADVLKPYFVAGCCATGFSFLVTVIIERLFRLKNRLPTGIRVRELLLAFVNVLGAAGAACSLVLLAVFDIARFRIFHIVSVCLVFCGLFVNSVCTDVEYLWRKEEYRGARRLKLVYLAAIVFIGVFLGTMIGFILDDTKSIYSGIEWGGAFGFTIFFFTYYYDLRADIEFSKNNSKNKLKNQVSGVAALATAASKIVVDLERGVATDKGKEKARLLDEEGAEGVSIMTKANVGHYQDSRDSSVESLLDELEPPRPIYHEKWDSHLASRYTVGLNR